MKLKILCGISRRLRKNTTLQYFEGVQKLQKYHLLNVPENLNQNSLREPGGAF